MQESPALEAAADEQNLGRWLPFLLAGCFFVAANFRLAVPSVWFDEAASWLNAIGTWQFLFHKVTQGEDCGGFAYAVLTKLWTAFAGNSELALRFPSVVAGVGYVLVLGLLARRLSGEPAACYAVMLAACHPQTLFWSRQARAYIFVLLATAGCLYACSLLIRAETGSQSPPKRTRWLLGMSLLSVTSLHIFGVFVVAGVFAWLLGYGYWKKAWREVLIPLVCCGGCFALSAGWIYLLRQRIEANLNEFWIQTSYADAFGDIVEDFFPFPIVMLPVMLAAWGFIFYHRPYRPLACLLLLVALPVFFGPLCASMLSHGGHHFVHPRYMLPLAPLMFLPLVMTLAKMPLRWAIISVLLVCGLWITAGRPYRLYLATAPFGADTRSAVVYLLQDRQEGEPLVVFPSHESLTLAYYGIRDVDVPPPGLSTEEVLRQMSQKERSWVMVYTFPSPRQAFDAFPEPQRFGKIRVYGPRLGGGRSVEE